MEYRRLKLSDMVDFYSYMIERGITEDKAATMAGMFAIANTIDNGFSHLMDDHVLGSLDLGIVHICDALDNIAESIEDSQAGSE